MEKRKLRITHLCIRFSYQFDHVQCMHINCMCTCAHDGLGLTNSFVLERLVASIFTCTSQYQLFQELQLQAKLM